MNEGSAKDGLSTTARRIVEGSCGREAEGGGLLNRYTIKSRIEGSNPSGSAKRISKRMAHTFIYFIHFSD